MTKKELIVAANKICGGGVKVEIVDAIFDAITNSLKSGEDVTLRGFGTFTVKVAKERVAQNMNAGTSVVIPEHKVVKFKPSAELKDGIVKS